MKTNQYSGFEVAVIGISFRTSGASNWREFWQNLLSSKESLCFLTDEELIDAGMDKDLIKNENFVNCTPNLMNKDCFDSNFFGYSNNEAKMMYPAHRFFHECAWEALEDAGYNPDSTKEPIGIYAGAGNDVVWKTFVHFSNDNHKVNNFYLNKISDKDYLSTLVSYKLGLTGPSMTINTACSTSLVAIHMACKALIFGETKIALAGASSLTSNAQKGYFYEEGSIFSKDGHCRVFDKDSTGTVDGEGTGIVVLKRLKDAFADRDNIYAIIKGSAINNDGNKKVGYTAPSVEGQVTCIKMAQKFSRIESETISYIETHGTGTKLGDSIEVEALNIAFNRNKNFSCPIGSVKTNIGHLDTAAGVAGFIKTVLSIKNKQIPASLHFNKPDPNINFQDGPFYVNNKLSDWKTKNNNPLRAAVNSFGVGGTNAHIILEEAPNIEKNSIEKDFKLLILSSKTQTSLASYLDKLTKFLLEEEDLNLSDMCYTYAIGRKHFENRIALSFKDKNELLQKLEEIIKQEKLFTKVNNVLNNIIFVFPGQGSQYINMGKNLYQSNLIFKEYMDNGFDFLHKLTNQDFKSILYSNGTSKITDINDTCFAQPLIFLIEYSLAKLLIYYGILPNYMIGHSIGEYTAACISGLFNFQQALKLVIKRGKLMYNLPKGSMISVSINEVQAKNFINNKISLATINAPEQVVFSGDDTSIQELTEKLTQKEISYVKLHTSHAFHSSMQDSILEEFNNEFQDLKFNKIQIPFISNLTGNFITNEEAMSSEYWTKQLRNTVQFSKGIKNLVSEKNNVFIEVGAGNSLSSLIKQHKIAKDIKLINLLRPPKVKENDEKYFIDRLGELWCCGMNINWEEYYKNEERTRVSLPTYAFDNIKYLTEVDLSKLIKAPNPLSFNKLEDSFYFPSWKRSILNVNKNIQPRIFLIFSDNSQCVKEIITEITSLNNKIIEVLVGEIYCKHSLFRYSINPFNIEDYKQLFLNLESEGIPISNVIYSWGLNVNTSTIKLVEENLELNLIYFCLTKIVKTWNQIKDKNIFILTNLLHHTIGNEKINYTQSLLLGPINVLPQETHISAINVDFDLRDKNPALIKDIVSEILNNNMKLERIISFRLGQRWVRDFQNGSQNLDKINFSNIKKKGKYLITGGLGNLGLLISKYLINEYQANIIVIGRKSLNEFSDNGELYEKRYKELKDLNENVIYFNVNISDIDELKEKVLENKDIFDNINGIIHAAGNVSNNDLEFIENTSVDKTINMLAPKVKGIENLYEVFKNYTLDFIWISSSLAVTFGGISLAAYAAANSYLDYFVFSKSGNFKCVELPKINFEKNRINNQQNILSVDEVIEVFEMSLNIKSCNIIYISKEDIHLSINAIFNNSKLDSSYNQINQKTERPILQTEYLSPKTETENKIKLIFEDFFEITNIGVKDDFFELGGDSLKAMVLLKKINQEFDIQVSISDFFSNKDIQAIANLIDEKNWLNANIDLKNEITI